MSEIRTSIEDAEMIRAALMCFVDSLDEDGFARHALGAAMLGFGLAVLHDECGPKSALEALDLVRTSLLVRMSKSH